ncbi:MAG: DNA repair exonuclease, partial [Calditrichaeota bacterium]|nr:DNA repair exonuclease [Calditrichota bacterium]
MRLLHTADWHLGKRLYGLDRRDELRAALEELARIAADEAVDAVVIAGDMIDRRVTDAEPIGDALEAMERFAAVAPVIIVAGNHDDPVLWTALAPYLAMRGVTLLGRPAEPARAITTV